MTYATLCTLNDAGPLLRPNSEFYLKPGHRLAPLFKDYPAALSNTLILAERCRFELQYGLQELPQFPLPPALTSEAYLRQLCEQAIGQRYPDPPDQVFAQLEAFGGYSFAKSHAASFAVIVYQSAWLKRYHPAAFLAALLNKQPMGYWSPAVLLGDARRHCITVLPVDIDRSQAKCVLEGNDVRGGLKNVVRLGFNLVDGFGEVSITRLVETRRHGSFRNLAGLCRRTRLPRRLVEHLILAGALDGWNIPHRRLLWELGTLLYQEEELDLDVPAIDVELPELSRSEEVAWEHRVLGLSTGDHVMTFYRDQLTASGILNSIALKQQPAGEQVKVAGLVVVHQSPPTAKGFHFLTLEDEVGLIDVIVRPQVVTHTKKLSKWHDYGLNDQILLLVEGTVQRNGNTVNVLATKLQPLIV